MRNQREKQERSATHCKDTKLNYHNVDFVLATKAFLVSFLKILSCDVLFFQMD